MKPRRSFALPVHVSRVLFLIYLSIYLSAIAGCASDGATLSGETPPLLGTAPLKQETSRTNEQPSPPGGSEPGPLTLDRAVEEALSASPDLSQINRRVAAAAEQVRQVEASFYPRLVLAEDFNVTDNPVFALMNIINQRRLEIDTDFNDPGSRHNLSSRIQAEWLLFEGGSRWFNRRASLHQRRSVQAEYFTARNRLVASVSETYFRWLQALAFIGVAERALESARVNEQLGEARLKVDMALPSELTRLKTQTAEAESNIITARSSARKLQAALERLLARPIHPGEVPVPTLSAAALPMEPPAEEPDVLVEKALDQRPEMEAVRSMVHAARERVKGARGRLLPSLGLRSWYGWDAEDLGESAESWLFGLQATWPIFEGGSRLSAIREAKIHLEELEARGRQVALDIALEVTQAALTAQEAAEKTGVAAKQKDLAEEALNETRHLYRNQVVTVDALIQAEVAWSRAETAYMAALFEARVAQALLHRALGDFADWVEESEA